MAKVVLQDLSKSFGSVTAVDKLSLEVADKEFLTILGPSGCGKTTTLRMIAGLEEPSNGDIYIGDTLVNQLPPKDRDLGMVFQNYALFPHMTVFENIAFSLRMRKVHSSEVKQKVAATADLLQIRELLDRKPKALSGGQQQRVALGRSIVREPKVFLMDEPLSNLDAKLRIYMRTELRVLQKKLGITTIYVTHDQIEAMTMSDRIALLNKGKLEQLTTPDEMYRNPASSFVGGFIGTPPMNLLEGKQKIEGNQVLIVGDGFSLDVTDYKEILLKDGSSELLLGIRPEDIGISKMHTANGIEAEVLVVESLGHEYLLDAKVGSQVLKVRVDSAAFGMGDKVWLTVDANKMHIFTASGSVVV